LAGKLGSRQALAAVQQPLGQETASQTQPLVEQLWPLGQLGALPQRQSPEEEQLFAWVGEQAKQLLPLVPHCCTEG